MNVICPKCHIPMVPSEDGTEIECQMCGTSFMVMLDDEKPKPEKAVSKERLLKAFESAKFILDSSMEKKAEISVSAGGNWGKLYFALLEIARTGFNVSEEELTGYILRAGISGMMLKYVSLLQMVMQSEAMVKEGGLRQETVDNLMVDLIKFNPNIDLGSMLNFNDGEDQS